MKERKKMEDAGGQMKEVEGKEKKQAAAKRMIRGRGLVTERDLLVLQWIFEQGTMTIDQLWRAV